LHDRRYLSCLGRARYVISNVGLPAYYRKKAGTTYLQTWHGTPLKKIAFDIPGRSFANSPEKLRRISHDVAKWDALVSPNPFSTEVLKRAFRYDGTVLETGYPRNDLLSDPQREQIRARVRDELGIPESARAVLYAPTWRDSHDFSLELDPVALLSELDDHYLLLRLHQRVWDAGPLDSHPRLRHVSDHPDNRELFLAADVLVTDYSSVMFDFAVTNRPQLFLTYDLESYRDDLRGFYFDFEAEAPGPLLSDTHEVIEALRDLDAVTGPYRAAYDAFKERFCGLEDGHASARVIEAIFD
jgi:CDP-glycerol glycerophosphotransferase